ncbi:hypothetical protein ACFV8T_33795 [Streptomyces sp. NPDC059832]
MSVALLVTSAAALVSALVAAFTTDRPAPSQERTDMAPAPVDA